MTQSINFVDDGHLLYWGQLAVCKALGLSDEAVRLGTREINNFLPHGILISGSDFSVQVLSKQVRGNTSNIFGNYCEATIIFVRSHPGNLSQQKEYKVKPFTLPGYSDWLAGKKKLLERLKSEEEARFEAFKRRRLERANA
ncbi:MAG: hypothetical protein AAB472_01930 [Patescibacteria group bacterium]